MKFDLHVHTNCSDGASSPKKVIRHASRIGLDGICITDHDTLKGYFKAKGLAGESGIMLLPGAEITTEIGDILAFGIEEVPLGSPVEVIDKIHSAGGIAVIAHPFGTYMGKSMVDLEKIRHKLDAIEVFNAATPLDRNTKAMEMAKKIKLPGIAASDAHFLEAIGSAFTIGDGNILGAIKKGRIKIGWLQEALIVNSGL